MRSRSPVAKAIEKGEQQREVARRDQVLTELRDRLMRNAALEQRAFADFRQAAGGQPTDVGEIVLQTDILFLLRSKAFEEVSKVR